MEIHCKFQDTTIVLVPSDQQFIKICETFEALGRFRDRFIFFRSGCLPTLKTKSFS